MYRTGFMDLTGSSIWWVSVLKFKSEYSSAAVTWPLLSEHTTTKTCIYCMNILHSLKSADWFELCRVAGNPVLADRSDRQTGPPAASVPPQQSRVLHCSGSVMRRLLTVSARRQAPRWARTDRTDRPHGPTDRPHGLAALADRTDRPHGLAALADRRDRPHGPTARTNGPTARIDRTDRPHGPTAREPPGRLSTTTVSPARSANLAVPRASDETSRDGLTRF